jgi:uncharacterized OsmC-like protein
MSPSTARARERQAPLRKAYSNDPRLAITTKHVVSRQTGDTDTWHGIIATPQFPGMEWPYGIDGKVGGDDDLPNPGHLLCAALAACVESTTRALAEHFDIAIDELEVEVVGDVDARGCLAIDPSVRSGFRHIDVEVRLRATPGTEPARVQHLMAVVEELCVTLETLRHGVPIDVRTKAST